VVFIGSQNATVAPPKKTGYVLSATVQDFYAGFVANESMPRFGATPMARAFPMTM